MKVFVTYGKNGKITSIGVPNPAMKRILVQKPQKGYKTAEVDVPSLDIKGKDMLAQFNKIATHFRVKVKGGYAELKEA